MPALPRRDLGFAYLRLCRGGDQAWQNFLNRAAITKTLRCRPSMGHNSRQLQSSKHIANKNASSGRLRDGPTHPRTLRARCGSQSQGRLSSHLKPQLHAEEQRPLNSL